MSKIIEHPSFKYTAKLLPLEPGHEVSITAKTLDTAESFDIFFGSDCEPSGDIQFHFSVNFNTDAPEIVRNSFTREMQWGEEEKHENLIPGNDLNPIKRGQVFKIDFLVDELMFYVTINGKPYCTFGHREPVETIQRVSVYGDIEKVFDLSHFSTPEARISPSSGFHSKSPTAVNGSVYVISGVPREVPGSFDMQLIENESERAVFQFTAEFMTKSLYFRSQNQDFSWRRETTENPDPFPFEINKFFKMAIGITDEFFIITIDGNLIAVYGHEELSSEGTVRILISTNLGLKLNIFGISSYIHDETKVDVTPSFFIPEIPEVTISESNLNETMEVTTYFDPNHSDKVTEKIVTEKELKSVYLN